VQHLIEREDLTEQDLDDLRRMIDRKRTRKHP
jgi:predicted transcriptional regulator